MSETPPPAKRQRLDDSAPEASREHPRPSMVYHEDGDCVLRAGGLLFKVSLTLADT